MQPITQQDTATRIRRATAIALALVSVGALAFGLWWFRDRPTHESVSEEELNLRVVQAIGAFRQAPPRNQTAAKSALRALLLERRKRFDDILKADPTRLLAHTADPVIREALPDELRDLMEAERTLAGRFYIEHEDAFDRQQYRDLPVLLTDDGQRYELRIIKPTNVPSGRRVLASGVQLGTTLIVPDQAGAMQEIEEGPQAVPTGTRKIAVVLFNFAANPENRPFTAAQVMDAVFTGAQSVNAYFTETSNGLLQLAGHLNPTGDVFDNDGAWYTIPHSPSVCSWNSWIDAARAAAMNGGAPLDAYDVVIYTSPYVAACGVSAARIGGTYAYMNGTLAVGSVAHELGHTFHAGHAKGYSCTDNSQRVPISATCQTIEYGDPYDVMGWMTDPYHFHFTAIHKGGFTWFDASRTQEVVASGTYTVQRYATPEAGVKTLRIPKTGTQYYYVEFRQPYGFDDFAANSPMIQGVTIHWGLAYGSYGAGYGQESFLIDATANSQATPVSDFEDAALPVGQTFTDDQAGVTIRTVSVSPTAATVEVTFFCTQKVPGISMFGNTWGQPGQPSSYTASLTNNDTIACGPSDFRLSAVLPPATPSEAWTQTPTTVDVTLAPGETQTVAFTVTPPGNLPDGDYSFQETLEHLAAPGLIASRMEYMIIDTTPPTITAVYPPDGAQFTASPPPPVLVSATFSDANQVAEADIFINDVLVQHCVRMMVSLTSCSFDWTNPTLGTHTIRVTVQDNAQPPNIGSTTTRVTFKAERRRKPDEISTASEVRGTNGFQWGMKTSMADALGLDSV